MTEENKKLLYDRYTKCRDLELDRFWKNSVFVWVFLALCYGAFGKIIIDYLSNDNNNDAKISQQTYEIILAVISFLGFFMSKIWIWMARGLKAWYEVYEAAVWDLESKSNVFDFDRRYTIENYWSVKTNGFRPFNSGRFSPSRIVILIGRLMSFAWIVSYGKWLYEYFDCTIKWGNNINWYFCITFSISILFVLLISFCVKTTTLRDSDDEILYRVIKNDLNANDFEQKYCGKECKNITQETQEQSSVSDNKSFFPKLYLSVIDNKIEFFFASIDEKNKYESTLRKYMEKKFDQVEDNILIKFWNKIKRLFKKETKRDDILKFENMKLKNTEQTQKEQITKS